MEDSPILSVEEQIKLSEGRREAAEASSVARLERQKENSAHRNAVDISWREIQNTLAIKELLTFVETLKDGHLRVATDGMAQKITGRDDEGNEIMELVNLNSEQRLGHLDRATGNDEILNYLIRHRS